MSSRDVTDDISTANLPREHAQGSSSSSPPPLYTTTTQQKQHETGSHPGSERASASSNFQGIAEPSSPTPCSIFTWGSAAVGGGQQQQVAYFEYKPLATPGDLQNEITSLITQHDAPPGAALGSFVATAHEQQPQQQEARRKPLVVLRGLSAPFVAALLKSPLNIDPAFVEAHAGGRRYRPRGAHRAVWDHATSSAHWDYPELVTGYRQALREGWCRPSAGSVGRPAPRPVSDVDRDLAAVFCRASLWGAGKGVDVLFLDEPGWQVPGSPLRRPRECWKVITTPEPEEDGRVRPSLEDAFQETMMMMDSGGEGGALTDVLEETAYDHWLDFFEVLTPGRESDVDSEKISLEWRIMESLDRNADMRKEVVRRKRDSPSTVPYTDWECLVRRLRLRVEMLSTMPPKLKVPTPKASSRKLPAREESFVPLPAPRHSAPADNSKEPSSGGSGDENQRSLDRVTYLGGILLPFSIVSGILSMNESFSPGQPYFWVFWVAAVPLAVFTLLLIYADKLRRAEVWVAVSVKGEDSSDEGDSIAEEKGRKEEQEEVARMRRRFRPEPRIAEPIVYTPQPETVTYGGTEDVVIDLGTPGVTAEPQTISAEPQTAVVEPLPAPPPPVAPRPGAGQDQAEQQPDEEGEEDSDDDGLMVIPAVGVEPPSKNRHHNRTWRKQQLGWGGAAMCMVGLRKPSRVSEGTPDGASGSY